MSLHTKLIFVNFKCNLTNEWIKIIKGCPHDKIFKIMNTENNFWTNYNYDRTISALKPKYTQNVLFKT